MPEKPGPNPWLELRDAASAMRLAVQMLNGPLAPWSVPAPDATRMREIIGALDQATRKVCSLMTTLQPSANDRPLMPVAARAQAQPDVVALPVVAQPGIAAVVV
ncbi:MAG: hypothetical protein IAG13_38535, partial [Deltaproteobacteria bacterium]|nr:hypothetical protein [Nannocystaceae bacterium]